MDANSDPLSLPASHSTSQLASPPVFPRGPFPPCLSLGLESTLHMNPHHFVSLHLPPSLVQTLPTPPQPHTPLLISVSSCALGPYHPAQPLPGWALSFWAPRPSHQEGGRGCHRVTVGQFPVPPLPTPSLSINHPPFWQLTGWRSIGSFLHSLPSCLPAKLAPLPCLLWLQTSPASAFPFDSHASARLSGIRSFSY